MTEPDWLALEAAWQPARAAGVLGTATTEEFVAHAAGYLPAACDVLTEFTGVDLGTGAGVPGVILALLRPASTWTLLDASERRCALAERAVRAMALGDRVTVRHGRADALARESAYRGSIDLVVARSFGDAAEVAECGLPLLAPSGRLVVSANAASVSRWSTPGPEGLQFIVCGDRSTPSGRYLEIALPDPAGERFPRRDNARRRMPLF